MGSKVLACHTYRPNAISPTICFTYNAKRRGTKEILRFYSKRKITTTFHYLPLHDSPMGASISGLTSSDLPVSKSISERIVRLPLFYDLAKLDIKHIVDITTKFVV